MAVTSVKALWVDWILSFLWKIGIFCQLGQNPTLQFLAILSGAMCEVGSAPRLLLLGWLSPKISILDFLLNFLDFFLIFCGNSVWSDMWARLLLVGRLSPKISLHCSPTLLLTSNHSDICPICLFSSCRFCCQRFCQNSNALSILEAKANTESKVLLDF